MRAGAEKAVSLRRRLEVVRGKIDAWERREGEWQARMRRRLWIVWAVMGVFAMLLVAALTVERIRPTIVADKHHNHTSSKYLTDQSHREWANLACDPTTSRNNESQVNWVMASIGSMVTNDEQEGICIATSTTATTLSSSAMPTDCHAADS